MQLHSERWSQVLTGMGMRAPIYLPLLTLTLYLLWRGYGFAISDQDEILPYLMHLLDTRLYQSDWFVNAQLSSFGPRTLFVLIAWLPAKVFGVYEAILGIYVLSWFGTSMALYTLGLHLTRERLAATLCVIFALLLTPKFTLGSNDLVSWILTPSMTAWTFSLWGLVFFVRERPILAGTLLGVGVWMQALVGLQMALICAFLLLWKHGLSLRRFYQFAGSFILTASPVLAPLIWFQLPRTSPEGIWSYFYILYEFRAPHHYLPSSFNSVSAVRFAILCVLGLISLPQFPKIYQTLVQRSLIFITALCIISFLGTEIVQISTIAKLQLFKLTVFMKVLFIILISNMAAKLILRYSQRTLTIFFDHGHYALGATVLIAITLLIISPNALGVRPTADLNPAEQIAAWAHDSTEVDAVFAVPPAWSHFRSQAKRAIVVNFKAVPFHQPYMSEWFTRLREMAPIPLPERGGLPLLPSLDSAFFALPADEIRRLSSTYGFEYIIRQGSTPLEGFESVYENDSLSVWHIPPRP